MSVQINYKNRDLKKIASNLVLFVGEKFDIAGLNKHISKSEFSYISDLLKTSDLKKSILSFKINSKKTFFLVPVKKDINILEEDAFLEVRSKIEPVCMSKIWV